MGRWEPEDPNTDAPKPHFEGTIHAYAEYAGLLTDDESVALWNFGRPDAASLRVTATEATAVMRYLPADLTAEVWADSSGNGYDLTAYDAPVPDYAPLPDGRELMIDTGIFYTNIAAGTAQKQIAIPLGYVPTLIALFNYNPGALTEIRIMARNGYLFIDEGSTNASYDELCLYSLAMSTNSTKGIQWLKDASEVLVNATGNTTTGGMRVRVFCRWVGY